MARGYCPECNAVMLLGANKCNICNWTQSNAISVSASTRCEKCGGSAREVKLRGSNATKKLCYEHYVQERDCEFYKATPVPLADLNRNIELVKKQNPALSDKQALERAQNWTQLDRLSYQGMIISLQQVRDKFYQVV